MGGMHSWQYRVDRLQFHVLVRQVRVLDSARTLSVPTMAE